MSMMALTRSRLFVQLKKRSKSVFLASLSFLCMSSSVGVGVLVGRVFRAVILA